MMPENSPFLDSDKMHVLRVVLEERSYQDSKWGTIDEHPHTVGEWLLILEQELDEAKEAWVKGDGDDGALSEIIQVVAVGFACLEQHGVAEHTDLTLDTLGDS